MVRASSLPRMPHARFPLLVLLLRPATHANRLLPAHPAPPRPCFFLPSLALPHPALYPALSRPCPTPYTDPAELDRRITIIPGVTETGLFANMAAKAFFGQADGSVTTRVAKTTKA